MEPDGQGNSRGSRNLGNRSVFSDHQWFSGHGTCRCRLGFPLLWLARDIQAHSWDYDLVGCADNNWAKPMRDEDGYGPDYRELDLNEEFWHQDPIPIAHGDKVSLSILGFEGEESDLASVSRWNVMFLDGYSGEADPELNTISIVKEPTLLLNGEVISREQTNSVLLRAGELLNARPIF